MSESTKLPRLPNLVWTQAIRDPIWDEIPITEVEKRIISTEAFYRLRGIKQLSFAYLAFPGAVHNRFEHSLGAMHATDMLLKMVRSQEEENGTEISSFERQLLRLAALLHDIGHPPFSHVMENLFSHYPDILGNSKAELPKSFNSYLKIRGLKLDALTKHEFFTEYIICQNEDIRRVIREWIETTTSLPKVFLPKYTETIINLIAQLSSGGSVTVNPKEIPVSIQRLIRIFKSIMSGDIDADKIDYLMRDNYYCGLPHRLDLTSLRNHLILRPDGLEIQPEARGFVHSLILARYRLITEVHQDMWGVYATAKVIELLHNLLVKEPAPAQLMLDFFTKWDDSKLLDYLIKSGDPTIKPLLTTQYPLKEVARLDNMDTHPYVRECIQILSEAMHHYQIPKLQEDLRAATGDDSLFVHVHSVKSPEFSMKLSDGGDLLRDHILRGISEESFNNLHLVVYGEKEFQVNFDSLGAAQPDLTPCEDCTLSDECIGNLKGMPQKRLLAELAVRRYRKIAQDCGSQSIIGADFLLLILEKIDMFIAANKLQKPIRQMIYQIAKLIAKNLAKTLEIKGNFNLKKAEISSTFDQEIRKYEQMGLIAYSRQVRKLPSEAGPSREVFRFDRRFNISKYGQMRLNKVRRFKDQIPEFKEYIKTWTLVETEIEKNKDTILKILSGR